MKKAIDAPIAQLVLDLEQRGLLNRTLIVLASEFSRDALIEAMIVSPNDDVLLATSGGMAVVTPSTPFHS